MQYSNLGISQRMAPPRSRPGNPVKPKENPLKDLLRKFFLAVIVAGMVWGGLSIASIGNAIADGSLPDIISAKAGYCIDDYKDATKAGSLVYSWQCNGGEAQDWSFKGGIIEKQGLYCLAANAKQVVIDSCRKGSAAESWNRDGVGLQNGASQLCLSLGAKTDQPLVLAKCNTNEVSQNWTPSVWSGQSIYDTSSPNCNQFNLGQRVACFAERQWLAWQTEPRLHGVLLSDYTDGNSNEEWCADFVSYVYREAGDPFSGGERNGWDEYNANNIEYQGFNYHPANGGYVPKPGDVAYFNYLGGHVEIVVSGGKHPTFIYGDSGTIDPQTGNGDMAKNQITAVAGEGQLEYYLSPQ